MYILIGFFKGDLFSYGRALIDYDYPFSVISSRIAYELRCEERLDEVFEAVVKGLGKILINSLCVIDKAVINGDVVEKQTVFYIVKDSIVKELKCDAVLGRDVVDYWHLVVDETSKRVYIAKDSKPFPR